MSTIESIAGPSVILQGRVSHALDQNGVSDAQITLEYRQGGAWLALPFAENRRAGGWYSVATSTQMLAGKLRLAIATDFRLTATHPKYQTNSAEVSLSAAEMTIGTAVVTVAGQPTDSKRLAGAPITLDLELTPKPVMLGGMVISDNQPDVPVAGAVVTIVGVGPPGETTGGDGRFRFDAIPMARTLDVQVTDGVRSINQSHTVDFDHPINQIVLSLITPPNP